VILIKPTVVQGDQVAVRELEELQQRLQVYRPSARPFEAPASGGAH
jgi:hypothetical protein